MKERKTRGYRSMVGLEKLSKDEIKARNLETYGSKIKHYRIKAGLIDTLLMIMPPMNDAPYVSDYKNIVAFKNFVERHEIAIVIIHHTRKLKAKDPFQEIVGTGGLAGAADTMMLLSREGRNSGKGKLVYTGRDLEDQEISLEFHKGDWRLAIETDAEDDDLEYEDYGENGEGVYDESGELAQMIIEVLDGKTRWEGTATEFSDATGGRIKSGGVIKKLKKCRDNPCGVSVLAGSQRILLTD